MPYLIVLAVIGLFLFGTRGTSHSVTENDTDAMLQRNYTFLLTKYPREIVQNVERIFRYETNNYTASFFFDAFSPGMNAFSNSLPYGWTSLSKLWKENDSVRPIGTLASHDHNSNMPLIVFPSMEAGCITLAEFLMKNNNDVGKWKSKNAGEQQIYRDQINALTPIYS